MLRLSIFQACADIEVAKAEKKYDREIELAEGNSYRVKKAESSALPSGVKPPSE